MAFFKKSKKDTSNTEIKVADVYVVTSNLTSSYDDGSGCGPMCVTLYFLAKCEDDEYYELFYGKKFEKKESKDGYSFQKFDTPYVEKVEPLKKYLKDPDKVIIDIEFLFDFITNMNVLSSLGAFEEEEDEESEEFSSES